MIDPRANSPEKLVPTPPLPMISRGALRRGMKRGDAYAWLSGRMGIPKAETHFGMFDLERCRVAYRVCMQALRGQQDQSTNHQN